jgi:hypothetical protein
MNCPLVHWFLSTKLGIISEYAKLLSKKMQRFVVAAVAMAPKTVYSQAHLTYTYDSSETSMYRGFEAREVW